MALAFVLGLVLTGLFVVRRVTGEVSKYESKGAVPRPSGAVTAATASASVAPKFASTGEDGADAAWADADAEARVVPESSAPEPDTSGTGTAVGPTAGAADGLAAAKFTATEPAAPPGPHGPGSAEPGTGGSGPEGWTVKGDEDSKLYHSAESPSYAVTRAEVWFRDVETAEAAGFNRWDSGKSQRGKN